MPFGSLMVLCVVCSVWLYVSCIWVATMYPLARWYERLVVPCTHPTKPRARLVTLRALYFLAALGYLTGMFYWFDREVVFSGKAELKQFYVATTLLSWIDWLVIERLGSSRPSLPT